MVLRQVLLDGLDEMINVSRRRYYEGCEIALCERVDMRWNMHHINVPSAPDPDRYERREFIKRRHVLGRIPYLGLYDEWIPRNRFK